MKHSAHSTLYTKDYSIFKKIDSNRDINKLHLKKLIQSIELKNLLYLFPVIINKYSEVVDGQHRIEAAKALKLDVYYIVDDKITKADIAMMNSNRKGWALKDYILFHAKEGNNDCGLLARLMTRYPKLNINSGCRLMDANIVSFYQGGSYSNKVRSGQLTSGNYALAEIILELAAKLEEKKVDYAFNGFFLLDIKNAIIQSGMLGQQAADVIFKEYKQFPKSDSIFTAQQQLRRIKDMLGVTSLRPYSSERERKAFLEMES